MPLPLEELLPTLENGENYLAEFLKLKNANSSLTSELETLRSENTTLNANLTHANTVTTELRRVNGEILSKLSVASSPEPNASAETFASITSFSR